MKRICNCIKYFTYKFDPISKTVTAGFPDFPVHGSAQHSSSDGVTAGYPGTAGKSSARRRKSVTELALIIDIYATSGPLSSLVVRSSNNEPVICSLVVITSFHSYVPRFQASPITITSSRTRSPEVLCKSTEAIRLQQLCNSVSGNWLLLSW